MGRISTSATSMPSADVPLITPATVIGRNGAGLEFGWAVELPRNHCSWVFSPHCMSSWRGIFICCLLALYRLPIQLSLGPNMIRE